MRAHGDEVGVWTQDKLEALRDYLEAYVNVLRQQEAIKAYYYIDGFAGLGKWKLKDFGRYIDGSPRVALKVKYPFTGYHFIELDPERVLKLQELATEFPSHQITVWPGDANDVLTNAIPPLVRWGDYHRAVAFLDPYAMHLDFATVEALAATHTTEVFINVPTAAIARDIMLNDPRQITPSDSTRGDLFWGSDIWQRVFYEVVGVDRVGRPMPAKIIRSTAVEISNLYRARLGEIFPYVSEVAVIRNTAGIPVYCLVFAGPNATGKVIVNRILERVGTPLVTEEKKARAARAMAGQMSLF